MAHSLQTPSDPSTPMVCVRDLTKRFGACTALSGVSFEVRPGEIVGILGPNGAGKTTLMRVLSGYLPADEGEARIGGHSVLTDSIAVRRRIGYLPERVPLYPDMRVVEYLRYRAGLKEVPPREITRRVREVMARCGLTEARRGMIGGLSKGFCQRVGLADALLNGPDLLILDEPTAGLDPNQIRQVRETIRELSTRHTILLSTHILPEVEMTCSRVLILNRGAIVASDTPDGLRQWLRGAVELVAEIGGNWPRAALENLPGVGRMREEPDGEWTRVILECRPGCDLRAEVFRRVAETGATLRELRLEHKSLEDVFVALTQHETMEGAS